MVDRWQAEATRIEAAGPAAPLTALPAISLDLETTGLHPKRDYIVQIGAIAISGNGIDEERIFESVIRPPVSIPQASVDLHRISDDAVAGAPMYSEIYGHLQAFCASRTIIGYSLEFDLAMLAEESARHGLPYHEPPWLDVRLLAAGIESGTLASLEELADRYGVSAEGRHSALADARMTAEIYLRLLPTLRGAGIRTYGQARALQETLSRSVPQAGVDEWRLAREARMVPNDRDSRSAVRTPIDGFIFQKLLGDLMQSPAIRIGPEKTLLDAARLMRTHRISSLVVDGDDQLGIVTHADIARELAEHGEKTACRRVLDACSRPLETMPRGVRLYRAVARMARRKRRHIGVTDESGSLVGMISLKTILRDRSIATVTLGDRIETASNPHELAAALSHLPRTAGGLFDDRLDGREVAGVVSMEGRGVTRRAAELAEARMLSEGLGPNPAPFCLLVLGSAGRGESMLAPDQDNALIIDNGYSGDLDDPEDWFSVFGRHLNTILDEAGIPFCKGGVMARERYWRRTQGEWEVQVDAWIASPKPEHILNVDIFFDMAPVHGRVQLAGLVGRHALSAAAATPSFARAMGQNAIQHEPPLGLLGRIRTNPEGRVDLKGGGLLPIVSAARAMALRHRVSAKATQDRLKSAFAAAGGSPTDLEGLLTAHEFLVRNILKQQIEDVSAGRAKLDNSVRLSDLDRIRRRALADALKRVSILSHILPTVLGGR